MLSVITETLLKVALDTNKTGHHVISYNWHIVESGIKHNKKNLATTLYIITDILLKVALNTNKTGHHVISYNWHIVENGAKHQ